MFFIRIVIKIIDWLTHFLSRVADALRDCLPHGYFVIATQDNWHTEITLGSFTTRGEAFEAGQQWLSERGIVSEISDNGVHIVRPGARAGDTSLGLTYWGER